ncbi:MAG: substrate-binding domain-containing protein [Phycisphaeraceae bacterium]|nr:substrate-binding domain-containing protein [Phycisphaeraceae bacterium]
MNGTFRTLRAGLAAVAAAGAVLAVTSGLSAASADKPRSYEFGVIAKSQSNPVFQAARTGAEDAAKELSRKHGVEIKINWRTPNNEDAQQQAQFVEQLASQGVDGIAISCSDGKLLKSAIDSAVDKGVEVVTFDSDSPESKRFAYYGINDEEAGRAVMRELAKAMGGKGVVAVLGGNPNAPNLQARIRGVREEAKKHEGITIKDVFYHAETAAEAAQRVQLVQSANPDITGWAMVGGWPLFTKNALDGVADKAKVTSVDHLPEQLVYVTNGQVQALIGQDCYGWGYRSVEMLFDKVHANKKPEKVINNFDLAVVTKENVSEFEGLWEKWLRKK